MRKLRFHVFRKVTRCLLAGTWQSQDSHPGLPDDKARPVPPPLEQQAQVSLPAPHMMQPCTPTLAQAGSDRGSNGEQSQQPCPKAGWGRPGLHSHSPRGACARTQVGGRLKTCAEGAVPADSVPVSNLGRQGQDSPPETSGWGTPTFHHPCWVSILTLGRTLRHPTSGRNMV